MDICKQYYRAAMSCGLALLTFLWTGPSFATAYGAGQRLAPASRAAHTVLGVRFINADAIADTLVGVNIGKLYLPTAIRWGKDELAGARQPVAETQFLYPDWDNLNGSFSLLRYNPEDTLTDMIWHLRGVANTEETQSRSYVVFGQSCLDQMSSVDLTTISDVQSRPYCAARLIEGQTLVDPQQRDLSERKSYLMKRMQLPLDIAADRETGGPAADFRIYPNPASTTVRLSAHNLASGAYALEIYAVKGASQLTQNLEVGAGGELDYEVDLAVLPAGFYIVELRHADERINALTLVVTR